MPIHDFNSPQKCNHGNERHHHHVVALTSSTLGSLSLTDSNSEDESMMKCINDENVNKSKEWSEMIEKKIPKTPTKKTTCHQQQPETINTWELMEGLEEAVIDRSRNTITSERSKSFNHLSSSPKPLWMQIAPEESIVSDFDPDVISKFRMALDELSSPPKPAKKCIDETSAFKGIVKARVQDFQKRIDEKRNKKRHCVPNGERKVVVYSTSLRGIRKTYEDCFTVKMILQGYGVKVDERDVSMHMGYKDELNEILGLNFGGKRLPRVVVNGEYIGGVDEISHMHEVGELEKVLVDCEKANVGKGGGVCELCGDVRFVPCSNCSGSCKIYVEEDESSGFRRCPECNENGLIRCSVCL